MRVIDPDDVFLAKTEESLAGAESEFASGRYNNCANRCYYACFQAAVHALLLEGYRLRSEQQWSHAFVQSTFVGQLVNRRKLYPDDLRRTLAETMALRQAADYRRDWLNAREASRCLRWAQAFVEAVRAGGRGRHGDP